MIIFLEMIAKATIQTSKDDSSDKNGDGISFI